MLIMPLGLSDMPAALATEDSAPPTGGLPFEALLLGALVEGRPPQTGTTPPPRGESDPIMRLAHALAELAPLPMAEEEWSAPEGDAAVAAMVLPTAQPALLAPNTAPSASPSAVQGLPSAPNGAVAPQPAPGVTIAPIPAGSEPQAAAGETPPPREIAAPGPEKIGLDQLASMKSDASLAAPAIAAGRAPAPQARPQPPAKADVPILTETGAKTVEAPSGVTVQRLERPNPTVANLGRPSFAPMLQEALQSGSAVDRVEVPQPMPAGTGLPLIEARAGGPGAAEAVPGQNPSTSLATRPETLAQDLGGEMVRELGRGKKELAIRLDPADLGRIDVRMTFAEDGKLRAVITADNPHTFDLLRRDADTLARALADAGLKTDGQGLRFDLRQDHQQGRQPPADGRGTNPWADAAGDEAQPQLADRAPRSMTRGRII